MKLYNKLLLEEGLKDYKISISQGTSDGIVLFKTKTIVIGENATMAMFLHELAHAITEEGHTGLFADKFTYLVDKYKKYL